MTTISHNDIARAIYLVSKDKTGRELHDIYEKIIQFLARRRLLSKSADILEKLNNIINKEKGRITAKVSGAKGINRVEKEELTHFLRKRHKAKEVIFLEKTDEKLLGGIKVEVGDEVIDLTVKNKIKELQEHLTRKI